MNEVAEFLKICEHTNFHHREELLTELNSGKTIFWSRTPDDAHLLSARHYLKIYQGYFSNSPAVHGWVRNVKTIQGASASFFLGLSPCQAR